jgi:hypothetical protein
VLITEFGTERNRTPYIKVKPYKMLGVSSLASRALALQVIHELIADAERAKVMTELMLKAINDSIRRCEAMGGERLHLRSVGARDQRGPGNLACILAEIRVRTITDTITQQIAQVGTSFSLIE